MTLSRTGRRLYLILTPCPYDPITYRAQARQKRLQREQCHAIVSAPIKLRNIAVCTVHQMSSNCNGEQQEQAAISATNVRALRVPYIMNMTAAPTPLLSNAVLRTDSESKPRCPEQTEAYNFTNL